jgi:tripartite-type tricarboxylate transporter receptor subunit TctC
LLARAAQPCARDLGVRFFFRQISTTVVIIDKLTAELNAVGQELDVRKRLDTFTVELSGLSGQAFADFARRSAKRSPLLLRRATSS